MKSKDIETMPVNQELLRLIAPQGIEIKSSRVHMGEFISKIQYISGYPSRENLTSEDEIINKITLIRKMYNLRIIVIAEGYKQGNLLLYI